MYKVKQVKCLEKHRLWVEFEHGIKGEYTIAHLLEGDIFKPLENQDFFEKAFIDEFGVISWPNGADLAPDALYKKIKESS